MPDIETCVNLLKGHQDFQVLRRLSVPERYAEANSDETVFLGVFIDVETTGLDTATTKVIEVGAVPFEYGTSGRILRVLHGQIISSLQDPGEPISPDITRLTGISDDMVRGQSIDHEKLQALFIKSNLVVAHNASFDRPIAERYWPVCKKRPWACSIKDVPWRDEGVTSSKLDYLAWKVGGFFFDGHRATEDCLAGIEILTRTLPESGRMAFDILRNSAAKKSFRIVAVDAPFENKDLLKSRGYRWDSGESGHQKSWWIEVSELDKAKELEWLASEVYGREVDIPISQINALNRYSSRI
ncbi:MAG: hypothetical protein HQM04_18150 [Magnetococcales bacterium]|nr:hypothetical protein [Magnetococcales bacterium]MBF0116950.1 hypothetical protein [Magnetococcales bacterium]